MPRMSKKINVLMLALSIIFVNQNEPILPCLKKEKNRYIIDLLVCGCEKDFKTFAFLLLWLLQSFLALLPFALPWKVDEKIKKESFYQFLKFGKN